MIKIWFLIILTTVSPAWGAFDFIPLGEWTVNDKNQIESAYIFFIYVIFNFYFGKMYY